LPHKSADLAKPNGAGLNPAGAETDFSTSFIDFTYPENSHPLFLAHWDICQMKERNHDAEKNREQKDRHPEGEHTDLECIVVRGRFARIVFHVQNDLRETRRSYSSSRIGQVVSVRKACPSWVLSSVLLLLCSVGAIAQDTLLNASYDVSRELYREINAAFAADWKNQTGRSVEIHQSHAGSSVQARAIIDGLEADVVTFNQVTDLDALVKAKLVSKEWRTKFPYQASPYRSIMVFIVRRGNPKGIKNWDDLVKPGIQIALANPKTSGNGRYAYLAAYGYALKAAGGDETAALGFMKKFYANVPVLDAGGRGATSTFAARNIGDVLLTFESEASLIRSQFGAEKIDVVIPLITMQVEFPIATIDPVVDRHKNRDLAEKYLQFLFSEPAQEIIAKFDYRPVLPTIADKYRDQYQKTELIDPDRAFGGWEKIQKTIFGDGGTFDRIYTP
jgi:sulfate/thiosulfate-binding protein